MKKHLFLIVLAFLITAFTIPAAASADILYAAKDTVKVYKKRDTDSKVIRKLKGGEKVLVEEWGKTRKWAGILCEDTKNGGQMIGWVQVKNMSYTLPSSFCNHNWSDWTVSKQPTCSSKGEKWRSCSKCGVGEMREIDRLEHDFTSWTVTKKATCAAPGEKYKICKVCGKVKTKEIEALPHTYGEWTVTKETSCAAEGERSRTCSVCGYVNKEAIAKLPHDLEVKIIQETTDHSAGIRTSVCRVCGYTQEQESFDPEGTLRRGDRSDEVREMQQLLVDQNYLSEGGADGIFGGGTEIAVMTFQKDQGLTPDGVAWPQTIRRLHHEFGPWTMVTELTRKTPGERMRECTDCGYEQYETIPLTPYLERGARSETVRAAQQMLTSLGYDTGAYDGIYGQKLDAAFSKFATESETSFEEGKITPMQIDLLVGEWMDRLPADTALQNGTSGSPVNLALTVTPADEQVIEEPGAVREYKWTLTNLGTEKAIFTVLLLHYGPEADFSDDNLVLVLDGETLEAACANEVSGTVLISDTWGEGDMHIAALAVSEENGATWLSNVESLVEPQEIELADEEIAELQTEAEAAPAEAVTEAEVAEASTEAA